MAKSYANNNCYIYLLFDICTLCLVVHVGYEQFLRFSRAKWLVLSLMNDSFFLIKELVI